MERDLEQCQMSVKELRQRMVPAPMPRERWYAILLLAQGMTAAAATEALERGPHIIGRWASAFGQGGPAALIFEQSGGSPRPWPSGRRLCQLELEGGKAVCGGAVRHGLESEQLPELAASLGICLQAAEEALGQGR